jgi:hypothetical protein
VLGVIATLATGTACATGRTPSVTAAVTSAPAKPVVSAGAQSTDVEWNSLSAIDAALRACKDCNGKGAKCLEKVLDTYRSALEDMNTEQGTQFGVCACDAVQGMSVRDALKWRDMMERSEELEKVLDGMADAGFSDDALKGLRSRRKQLEDTLNAVDITRGLNEALRALGRATKQLEDLEKALGGKVDGGK